MGSSNFLDVTWTNENQHDAYERLYDDAMYESGYGANGTISTTNGVLAVHVDAMTESGAVFVAELGWSGSVLELSAAKRGSARSIALLADEAFVFTTKKFILGTGRTDLTAFSPIELRRRFTASAELEAWKRFGGAIHQVKVDTEFKTKVVQRRPAGKAVTMYQVEGFPVPILAKAEDKRKRFTSKAEAMAWARKAAADHPDWSLSVSTVRVYAGEDANTDTVDAQFRSEVTKAVVTVTVTLARKRARIPKGTAKGWAFYGWAAE